MNELRSWNVKTHSKEQILSWKQLKSRLTKPRICIQVNVASNIPTLEEYLFLIEKIYNLISKDDMAFFKRPEARLVNLSHFSRKREILVLTNS